MSSHSYVAAFSHFVIQWLTVNLSPAGKAGSLSPTLSPTTVRRIPSGGKSEKSKHRSLKVVDEVFNDRNTSSASSATQWILSSCQWEVRAMLNPLKTFSSLSKLIRHPSLFRLYSQWIKTFLVPEAQEEGPSSSQTAEWYLVFSLAVFPPPVPNSPSNSNSVVNESTQNQHLSTLTVLPLSLSLYIFSSLPVTFPAAPSSYLRPTAPARASSTSWAPRLSQRSRPTPRRSALFLRRGSAPSARAPIAWPTATRSEAWNLWERPRCYWKTCRYLIIMVTHVESCFLMLQITADLASPPPSPTR